MKLTFLTDLGHTYSIEIDPTMELENVMALLEAESGIPMSEQSISYEGRDLNNPKQTMSASGVKDDAMLLLRRKITVDGRTVEHDAEMMRLQLLGDPELMRQLRETNPDVADAAQNNPVRFIELLGQTRQRYLDAGAELERLDTDPYNVEAQRRIEEEIRQQAVLENMEHAMEYSPESFARVTMLYIPVEVNGYPLKAFVDSGAQSTIMSPSCAEACGIMRLIDRRFEGIAMGVGTAKILGKVHSAQLKLADVFLPCSFTIMEGQGVELLFGLDMLKAHQACIDLEKNVLRIQGREVKFLAEHELPEKARPTDAGLHANDSPGPGPSSAPSNAQPSPSPHFPGSGNTLGTPPANVATPVTPPTQGGQRTLPEESIRALMDLGASRQQAISLLTATRGNLEAAAALLF